MNSLVAALSRVAGVSAFRPGGRRGFFVNAAAFCGPRCDLDSLEPRPHGSSLSAAVTFTWWGNRTLTFPEHAQRGLADMVREWSASLLRTASAHSSISSSMQALVALRRHAPLSNPFVALAFGVLAGMVFNFTLSKRSCSGLATLCHAGTATPGGASTSTRVVSVSRAIVI